ncbi:LIM domain [Popillia japonica]|uniref:LIM domain n=1 Tax=Popillia japonica TaxID=7064 RepID=A0AAW1K3W7_POPJA
MPNCPKCEKPVYFAERKTSLGKDWHAGCLRCEKCNKTLTPGSHAEHEGKPYCTQPCYNALFGPTGFGRGGAESYVYKK